MNQTHKLIDVVEAKTFIEANWPNDPLLKTIAMNLLDKLPAAEPRWFPADHLPELHLQKWEDPDEGWHSYEASAPVIGVDVNGTIREVHYEQGPVFCGWTDERCGNPKIVCWMPKPPHLRNT